METQLTDSQKLDAINKRLKRMEVSTDIHTIIIVIGFLGILSFSELLKKVKTKVA